jgi:hypothetical protein
MEYVATTWHNEDYETQEKYPNIDDVNIRLYLDVEYSKQVVDSDIVSIESIQLDSVEFLEEIPFSLEEIIYDYYKNLGEKELKGYLV